MKNHPLSSKTERAWRNWFWRRLEDPKLKGARIEWEMFMCMTRQPPPVITMEAQLIAKLRLL